MTTSADITYRFSVKLIPRIVALLVIIAVAVGAEEANDFATTYADALQSLAAYTPRTEGSEAEELTFEYIESYLGGRRIEYRKTDFADFDHGHSFSQLIEATIPGTRDDELILAIPINGRISSDTNSSRVAFGMAIASALSELSLPVGVRILYLGAEFGESSAYPMGSERFLREYLPESPAVVFYFDLEYAPERLIVRAGDAGEISPYWLVESATAAMDAASLFYLVRGNETQFYRIGLSLNPAPLESYLDRSIPGISFHSGGDILNDEDELVWAARMYEFVIGFIIGNDRGFSTEWDRHYLFFQARSIITTIRERSFITLIVVILQLMVLYPLVKPARFRNYMASMVRFYWALPVLLGLVFALLFVGTLLVEALASIKRFPDIWQTRPAMFFGLKMTAAIFLFALLFRYVRRIPFPRRGRYYNAVTLVLLYVDIIVLGAINISLSYYVVWACIWAFLFSLASSRTVKGICLLISPIWFVKAAYDVFTLPELNVSEVLILSRLEGNLILALLLLPFLCMLIRLDFMFRHPRRRTKRLLFTVMYSTLGVMFSGLFIFLLIQSPYDSTHPQPISIAEEMVFPSGLDDKVRAFGGIRITSPAPLKGVAMVNDEAPPFDSNIREWYSQIDPDPSLVTVAPQTSEFLGRKRIRLDISSHKSPDQLEVRIESDNELIIYDANFPYSYESFGFARIHIGRYPPIPIYIEFTIPADQAGNITIEAIFEEPDSAWKLDGPAIEVNTTRRIVRIFDIAGMN